MLDFHVISLMVLTWPIEAYQYVRHDVLVLVVLSLTVVAAV